MAFQSDGFQNDSFYVGILKLIISVINRCTVSITTSITSVHNRITGRMSRVQGIDFGELAKGSSTGTVVEATDTSSTIVGETTTIPLDTGDTQTVIVIGRDENG
jgi:hypothetical protein